MLTFAATETDLSESEGQIHGTSHTLCRSLSKLYISSATSRLLELCEWWSLVAFSSACRSISVTWPILSWLSVSILSWPDIYITHQWLWVRIRACGITKNHKVTQVHSIITILGDILPDGTIGPESHLKHRMRDPEHERTWCPAMVLAVAGYSVRVVRTPLCCGRVLCHLGDCEHLRGTKSWQQAYLALIWFPWEVRAKSCNHHL